MTIKKNTILDLIRLGIKTEMPRSFVFNDQKSIQDWDELRDLAERNGVFAIVLDGLEQLSADLRPPQELLLQWIGEVLQNYEARYDDYRKRISELAAFYNQQGYRMMVLKGYGLSMNYPRPSHRPCGDIDIWLFGKQKEADDALRHAQGAEFKIDKSHHHHTVFGWKGYMVENHYDFVNVHYGHENAELEQVFKKLAEDDSNVVEIEGQPVYLPSANLHALFLLRHCMQDFASSVLILRQVLDWGFFIEKHTSEIDWDWLRKMLEKFNMIDFFNCINAICVEDLGFELSIFQTVRFLPEMKERVLNDILSPKYSRDEPKWFVLRIVYKYRRWHGNAWKQKLCYKESRWSVFWSGVWNHLIKPSSI